MNREEIKRYVPHRGEMLLLDEARVTEQGAAGSYTVRGDEFFLNGHFPNDPVVPGVILCEIIAQTACIINAEPGGMTPYLAQMSNVRFKRKVRPGDRVETECRIIKKVGNIYFADGSARVGGETAVTMNFAFSASTEG